MPNRNKNRHGDGFQGVNYSFRSLRCSSGGGYMLRSQGHIPILADHLVIHQQRKLFEERQADNLSSGTGS